MSKKLLFNNILKNNVGIDESGTLNNGGLLGDITTINSWTTRGCNYEYKNNCLVIKSFANYSVFYDNSLPVIGIGTNLRLEGVAIVGGSETWFACGGDPIYLNNCLIDDTHFALDLPVYMNGPYMSLQIQLSGSEEVDTEIKITKMFLS